MRWLLLRSMAVQAANTSALRVNSGPLQTRPRFAGSRSRLLGVGTTFWDVAARYSVEVQTVFKLASLPLIRSGSEDFFSQEVDPPSSMLQTAREFVSMLAITHLSIYFQVGAYVPSTFLPVSGSTTPIGSREIPGSLTAPTLGVNIASAAAVLDRADGDTYYIKGGLRERWDPLVTVRYGEYARFRRRHPDFLANVSYLGDTHSWGLRCGAGNRRRCNVAVALLPPRGRGPGWCWLQGLVRPPAMGLDVS